MQGKNTRHRTRAAAAADGLIVLETSTLTLADKAAGQRALASCGGILLDCPLSGAAAAKARVRPVLADMTRQVYDVGTFGLSHVPGPHAGRPRRL